MKSDANNRNSLFNSIEQQVSTSIRRLELLCNPKDQAHAKLLDQALERYFMAEKNANLAINLYESFINRR